MHTIIVVPAAREAAAAPEQIRLGPGDRLRFGRSAAGTEPLRLTIDHPGVSRTAGEITAAGTHWALSNFSRSSTYVVENPEGAGEHIKVAAGRIGAPVPFEFSRIVLPAADELLSFDVWAPRHDYAGETVDACDGEPTTSAFPLDRSKRYFLVLAALCEPRLRGAPHAPAPTVDRIAARLRPLWPGANRTAVQWNIDYLAVKLRIKPGPDTVEQGPRLHGKKETLVSLALRFDLVREDDLAVLAGPPGGGCR
ncbi:FHA domain-containing protein [Streptomyces genisteinicus]|uniref:FHA domain-containing protein n=1 Tax=Streptomyces genisteinicus TaxID=2768068 RepID=A0A7H0HWC7_9ACTN|nr:FHA domain-containing protein [Streptomyces genisteinicus]QNP64843.1 FHA domain-containing protein [Streptomyces genisteinicus]